MHRCDRPRVSVVVPTRNRAPLLLRLLAALGQQEYPTFEIIVVDDASTDATGEVLEAWRGKGRTVLRAETASGSYVGRERGWRGATGEIVAFTDDDCVPEPGWLEELVAPFADSGVVAVQGETRAEPGEATPFTHQIEQREGGAPYRTCNIAYRRETLEALNGFDAGLRHGADTLLGLRARRLGPIVFAPAARVRHPPRAREWRDRVVWEERFREDARFRDLALRYGMTPGERREIEPVNAGGRGLPIAMWVLRPIRNQLGAHLAALRRHPLRYVVSLPPMLQERREMVIGLARFYRDRERGTWPEQ